MAAEVSPFLRATKELNMYKVVFAVTFKGPDRDASREHWKTRHADLALATPELVRYVQNEKLKDLAGPRFDALSELYFEDEAAYEQAMASDYWNKTVLPDGENFIEWETTGAAVVSEAVLRSGPPPAPGSTGVRRVVTGQRDGVSCVASDEMVPVITVGAMPGTAFYSLWGTDETPTVPADGTRSPSPNWFPPTTGSRFALGVIPPAGDGEGGDGELDEAALAEAQEKLPGLLEVFEAGEPGMHTSASIDYFYFLSGQVTLELGDGSMTELHAGDAVVMNGTRHRWINGGSEPCVLLMTLLGAPTSQLPETEKTR